MSEQSMTGAFVSLDICGGPQQGMGTTACVSIGGQPAQPGQKVLTPLTIWYLLDGNSTTLPNGDLITDQNTGVALISYSNVANGTPCNPTNYFQPQTAWSGGCVLTPPPPPPPPVTSTSVSTQDLPGFTSVNLDSDDILKMPRRQDKINRRQQNSLKELASKLGYLQEDFKNPILDKYLKLKKSIDYKTVFPTDLQSFLDSLDNTERDGLENDLAAGKLDKKKNSKNFYDDDEDLTFEPEDGVVDEVELEDLDFETLKAAFPKFYQNEKFTRTQPNGEEGPYYSDSISFPNLDDSTMEIGDSSALEDWKDKVLRRFGNVEIVFNDEAKNSFDRVFVSDDAFNDARDGFIRGKMKALNR